MNYDSRTDTEKHIKQVQDLLSDVMGNLAGRSLLHDASKLTEPEKSTYDEFTPKLRDSTYGSDEYKGFLKDMGVALEHHYKNNSHHPEHYEMWQCPICESVFTSEEAPIGITDARLCPKCNSHGSIYETSLVPISGVYGMTLLDLIEMLVDWKAATARHADGDIRKSLEINRERFGISNQLYYILRNTVSKMGW